MNILAFDTTMAHCAVAVLHNGAEICRSAPMGKGQAERLIPMISEVMSEAGLRFSELGRICVTTGPGSFTGVRIGIAAARGLALASGAELVGLNTLEALAATAAVLHPQASMIAALLDARRDEIYLQLFALKDGRPTQASAPKAMSPKKAAAFLADKQACLIGSGASLVTAHNTALSATLPHLVPDPLIIAKCGRALGKTDTPVGPLYLRAPDAKPQSHKVLIRYSPP